MIVNFKDLRIERIVRKDYLKEDMLSVPLEKQRESGSPIFLGCTPKMTLKQDLERK